MKTPQQTASNWPWQTSRPPDMQDVLDAADIRYVAESRTESALTGTCNPADYWPVRAGLAEEREPQQDNHVAVMLRCRVPGRVLNAEWANAGFDLVVDVEIVEAEGQTPPPVGSGSVLVKQGADNEAQPHGEANVEMRSTATLVERSDEQQGAWPREHRAVPVPEEHLPANMLDHLTETARVALANAHRPMMPWHLVLKHKDYDKHCDLQAMRNPDEPYRALGRAFDRLGHAAEWFDEACDYAGAHCAQTPEHHELLVEMRHDVGNTLLSTTQGPSLFPNGRFDGWHMANSTAEVAAHCHTLRDLEWTGDLEASLRNRDGVGR